MSEKKAIRQELVLLLRKMFFDSSSFSTSMSWVPVANTEPSLFGQSVGHVVVKILSTLESVFWLVPRGTLC